ncbi:hypothetical protein F4808DRAFT_465227 [Astrocystis sublimbata]|nr:hypothetical protein F4808DRAFT_465227 [Astrocystis sublimbata]
MPANPRQLITTYGLTASNWPERELHSSPASLHFTQPATTSLFDNANPAHPHPKTKMVNPTPQFWAGPLRYWRWAARERPALFFSCVIGGAGPVILLTVPPLLKQLGYERAKPIPMTYPVPAGPRKQLSGYDD